MTFDEWWEKTNEIEALKMDYIKAWDAALLHSGTRELYEACLAVVGYRNRSGPLGFQLEKADDYFDAIRAAIAKYEACVGAKP